MSNSVLSLKQLLPIIRKFRRHGKKIAFTNGCFDLLHIGHLSVFERIKRQADILIVGVNADASVRRLKGSRRPIVPAAERARMVAGLKLVDYVVLFAEDTPLKLIRAIQPDILAKGGDWKKEAIVGADLVEARGGRILRVPYIRGRSSTGLLKLLKRV